MRKVDRADMIYAVALAGVSAALAIIFVTLGVYVRFTTVAFFVAAGLSIMIPLTKRYWFSSVAALVVSGVASFFIAGSDITAVGGYVVYFGPMALLAGIMYNLHVKWYVQVPVKLIFVNGALALLYFVLGTIVVDEAIMQALPYWAIAIIGSVLLMAVDTVQVFVYSKLAVIVGRALRTAGKAKKASEQQEQDDYEDPFEEELYRDIYPQTGDDAAKDEESGEGENAFEEEEESANKDENED